MDRLGLYQDLSEQAAELRKDLPGEVIWRRHNPMQKVKEELDIVSIEYEKGSFIRVYWIRPKK